MPKSKELGYTNIPPILFDLITFIVGALPVRSIPTFIELLIGAMLTQSGFVTDAFLIIDPLRNWTTYYKWLQKGIWSWLAVAKRLAEMVHSFFPQQRQFLIIDDTLVYRHSAKAPGSSIYHQHGNKPNRPQYARGQCWVTMALSVGSWTKNTAVPLLSRLMRSDGNSGKLDAANVLIRAIAEKFTGRVTYVLIDAWFMKWPLIKNVLAYEFNVIGQVRKDTALYLIPEKIAGKRGAPRKMGNKIERNTIDALEESIEEAYVYGKYQTITYRSCICIARFMDKRKVRAVWTRFEDKHGKADKERLLISTDLNLDARSAVLIYGRRWGIESLFNQMKNFWGWKETWQQTRQTLHRWVQILSVAYALPQLLSVYCQETMDSFRMITPWRKNINMTAGQVRLGLKIILRNVRVRDWWCPKLQKFQMPLLIDSQPLCNDNKDYEDFCNPECLKNDNLNNRQHSLKTG